MNVGIPTDKGDAMTPTVRRSRSVASSAPCCARRSLPMDADLRAEALALCEAVEHYWGNPSYSGADALFAARALAACLAVPPAASERASEMP